MSNNKNNMGPGERKILILFNSVFFCVSNSCILDYLVFFIFSIYPFFNYAKYSVTLPCPILSYLSLLYLALLYLALPYPTLPYLTLCYLALSCLTLTIYHHLSHHYHCRHSYPEGRSQTASVKRTVRLTASLRKHCAPLRCVRWGSAVCCGLWAVGADFLVFIWYTVCAFIHSCVGVMFLKWCKGKERK